MPFFRNLIASFALLESTFLYADSQQNSQLNPDVIMQKISKYGAGSVISTYYDGPYWTEIDSGISSGSSKWVAVALALSVESDGAVSEDIDIALGMSINANPSESLTALKDTPLEDIKSYCGSAPLPGESPLYLNTNEDYINLLDQRLQKLLSAKNEGLASQVAACKMAIENSLNRMKKKNTHAE